MFNNPLSWRCLKFEDGYFGSIINFGVRHPGVGYQSFNLNVCYMRAVSLCNPVLEQIGSTFYYGTKVFDQARIVYTKDIGYLELICNHGSQQSGNCYITIYTPKNSPYGKYEYVNLVGSIPSGYSSKTINL